MNGQINRLQSFLERITQKRDHLQKRVSALRRRITPIPTEILQQIFGFCLEAYPVISSSSLNEAPILLTRVCSRWRSVVLDTPDLWSAMHIAMPSRDTFAFTAKYNRIQRIMDEFINRSRSLPLHISVYFRAYPHPAEASESDSELLRILQSLAMHSKRWKTLHLDLPVQCFTLAMSQLTSEDVPLLETAVFAGQSIDFLSNAQSLRQLALEGHFNSLAPLPLDGIMWSKLQVLKLHVFFGSDMPGLFSVLGVCQDLRECILDLSFLHEPMNGVPPVNGTLVLPYLKTLRLIDPVRNDALAGVLDRLTLPALEVLDTRTSIYFFRIEQETLSCLASLLERSTCSLTELSFVARDSPALTSAQLMQFLRHTCLHTSLRKLTMNCRADFGYYTENGPWANFVDDDLLQALAVVSAETALCPNLTRLEFTDGCCISESALLDLISARMHQNETPGAVKPLKHLLVYTRKHGFASSFDSDDLNVEGVQVIEEVDLTRRPFDIPTYSRDPKESYGPFSRDVIIDY